MDDVIRIDAWSDIACPWCYIGKRRLEAGLAAFAEHPAAVPVTVRYRSFQLAPDTPLEFEGSEVDFLVRHKRMPEADVRRMLATVTSVARSVGLEYRFDAVRHSNTLKAHQVLQHAKAHGLQAEANERLLRAYFVEGRHLGRDDVLAALAADVGLDAEAVLAALRDGRQLAAVHEDEALAARLGIRGVPFFVIDGGHGLSGAQRPEAFAEALVTVATERSRRTA